MRRFIVLGFLLPLLSFPAIADAVYRDENVEVHFYATDCEISPVARFLRHQLGQARSALVIFNGQRVRACYAKDDEGDFLIVDERGQGGWIPGSRVNVGS